MNPIKNKQYLYIVRCNNAYKIGVSSLPEQRVSLIKTDNYQEVEVLHIIQLEHAYEVEKDLHDVLKEEGYHIRGEWFNSPETPIDDFFIKSLLALDKEYA